MKDANLVAERVECLETKRLKDIRATRTPSEPVEAHPRKRDSSGGAGQGDFQTLKTATVELEVLGVGELLKRPGPRSRPQAPRSPSTGNRPVELLQNALVQHLRENERDEEVIDVPIDRNRNAEKAEKPPSPGKARPARSFSRTGSNLTLPPRQRHVGPRPDGEAEARRPPRKSSSKPTKTAIEK